MGLERELGCQFEFEGGTHACVQLEKGDDVAEGKFAIPSIEVTTTTYMYYGVLYIFE